MHSFVILNKPCFMKPINPKKYLYKHYNKEVGSFFEDLEKTRTDPNIKNIHNLRVDIKKVKSFFHLLEILFPKKFKAEGHAPQFDVLFKSAGDVREAQLISFDVSKYKFSPAMTNSYKQ